VNSDTKTKDAHASDNRGVGRGKIFKEENAMLNRLQVEALRLSYPHGSRIRLIEMKDDPCPVLAGSVGVVDCVDDAGGIHTHWDELYEVICQDGVPPVYADQVSSVDENGRPHVLIHHDRYLAAIPEPGADIVAPAGEKDESTPTLILSRDLNPVGVPFNRYPFAKAFKEAGC
jgi:hypothetical protein